MRLLTLVFILLGTLSLAAQKNVDIRLKQSSFQGKESCYDIDLRSPNGHDIALAGQNYRLFYDSDKLSYLEDKTTHELDRRTYGKMDVLNTTDKSIGFLSLSFEGRILSDKGIKLTSDGEWTNTMNVCFEQKSGKYYDITWANPKRTSQFATVEIAMSEWLDRENQQILVPNEIYDFSSFDALELSQEEIILRVFPNPVADLVTLSFEHSQDHETIIIKDVIGREVVSDQVNGAQIAEYNLTGWPEGTYTILVLGANGDRLHTEKLIKINP